MRIRVSLDFKLYNCWKLELLNMTKDEITVTNQLFVLGVLKSSPRMLIEWDNNTFMLFGFNKWELRDKAASIILSLFRCGYDVFEYRFILKDNAKIETNLLEEQLDPVNWKFNEFSMVFGNNNDLNTFNISQVTKNCIATFWCEETNLQLIYNPCIFIDSNKHPS